MMTTMNSNRIMGAALCVAGLLTMNSCSDYLETNSPSTVTDHFEKKSRHLFRQRLSILCCTMSKQMVIIVSQTVWLHNRGPWQCARNTCLRRGTRR